jgi:C7-cyclitol 7-kinase
VGDLSDGPILVLEVGGTNLRAALFDPETGELSRRRQALVRSHARDGRGGITHQEIVEALRLLSLDVLDDRTPRAVAVAYPGPINTEGVALAAPTLVGETRGEPFPIKASWERLWPDARVLVVNDLTAAGYRYIARGATDFCVLTVGSGIGHKVFLDGRPCLGRGARGGEIGHLRLAFGADALRCDCGGRGHLGAVASGRGTVRLVQSCARRDRRGFLASTLSEDAAGPEAITSEAVVAAFTADDEWVRETLRRAASYLGTGLAAIHLAVGVEQMIITGGFAHALGDPYRQMLVEAAAGASWQLGQDWNSIVELGIPDDEDGLIGGGLLAGSAFGRG